MSFKKELLLSVSCAALICLSSMSQAASFEEIGDLPGGIYETIANKVSADGTTVVGHSDSSSGTQAFRWTLGGGIVGLGDLSGGAFSSVAYSVNSDGSIVVGRGTSSSGSEAFRWTAGGGIIGLGDLAGGSFYSVANGISADGTTIVGQSSATAGNVAFRWTSGGGMASLGDLAGGATTSYAISTNADGSVVVGYGTDAGGRKAMRWTSGGGMVSLGDLAGGATYSTAYNLNSDGSVVVGFGISSSGVEAFRWTSGTGMVGLGDLAGGTFESAAVATNGDGSVVVGYGTTASGSEAFRWTQANGMETISSILTAAGVDLTGYTLVDALSIDSTGDVVVGSAQYGGDNVAYIANLATAAVTTTEDLEESLSSGIVPVQQAQTSTANSIGQSLVAATQSAAFLRHNGLGVFDESKLGSDISVASISPAAGDSEYADTYNANRVGKNYAVYAVGTFGFASNNNPENTSLNGTTGLMVKMSDDWVMGLGVIGNESKSEMPHGGESKLAAAGASVISSYETVDGLGLYGALFAAHIKVDTQRNYMNGAGIDSSNGETEGMGYGLAVRGGWEFDVTDDLGVMPYAEIHLSKTDIDSYTETGGGLPASFGRSNTFQARSKIGTQLSYEVTPSLSMATRLSWGHRLHEDDSGIYARASGFGGLVTGPEGDKDWAEISIDGGWQATDATRLSAEISGRSGRTSEPAASITFGVSSWF